MPNRLKRISSESARRWRTLALKDRFSWGVRTDTRASAEKLRRVSVGPWMAVQICSAEWSGKAFGRVLGAVVAFGPLHPRRVTLRLRANRNANRREDTGESNSERDNAIRGDTWKSVPNREAGDVMGDTVVAADGTEAIKAISDDQGRFSRTRPAKAVGEVARSG
jgi:hypothetical protein